MRRIAKASLIIAVFFLADKILGFIRQIFVARQFSLSYDLDVFNAANNIPDLLSALISGGALGVALIPVLSEYINLKSSREAWILFSRIINFAFIVTGFFSILIAIFAPWLVSTIIAPGFPEEQKTLTIHLMRLDLIAILIFSISGLVMAGLQANQHFLTPALAPGLYNIGQIIGVMIFSPKEGYHLGGITLPAFGLGIEGLVYGVILGACLHLLVQVPGLIKHRLVWIPSLGFGDEGVKRVFRLLGPRVATMFFLQIFFIARDNLASRLGEGAISAINLGWFIMQVPETLLGSAMAIAILPSISELIAQKKYQEFSNTVNNALKILFALCFPSAVYLSIGLFPLVQTAFHFSTEQTQMVVVATQIYLLGLISHAYLEISSRSFYAQQNAKTPLLAAAFNAAIFIPAAILLTKLIGYIGIPLAITFSFTAETLLLLKLLMRNFRDILVIDSTMKRTLLGTALFAIPLWTINHITSLQIPAPVVSIVSMTLCMGFTLFFILPEIRLLIHR